MRVYTDGACTNNGKKNARAGSGAWYPDTQLGRKWKVPGKQTNQRAEIVAVSKAIEYWVKEGKTDGNLDIFSDSKYTICSLRDWSRSWNMATGKKKDNKPISNLDLLRPAIALFRSNKESITLTHVPAHNTKDKHHKHNDMADWLAREAGIGKLDDYRGPTRK